MFSQRIALGVLALTASACVTTPAPAPAPVDAGVSEAQVLGQKITALETEARVVLSGIDEILWNHWTTGAPLELSKPREGHDALLSAETLKTLRRARELQVEPKRVDDLERWVAGELLSRGTATESADIAALEATLTFTVDGREHAWRDLPRLLVNERSAVKRRALWAGSNAAAKKLEEVIVKHEARVAQVTQELGLPTDFEVRSRGLSPGALKTQAEELLASTDEEWTSALQRLSDADVKLPTSSLTRGDLPRLLRVPANVDNEFSKDKLQTRLSKLGGLDGLKVDLTDSPKKNFVPLAVAPSPTDVRLSGRPVNGLREQQQLVSEAGVALSLRGASRLQDPAIALGQAELYSALFRDDAWLTEGGVALRAETIAASRALWLFQARRAAALLITKLEVQTMTDDAAAR
ncbi:MAG: hypothetical protein ACO1OB_04390, partial [Archangium sp.]